MTTVLVVEDQLSVLDNIVDTLEAEGFHVIAAENGQIGYQKARKLLPDLIISDIMMPVMDGHELLEAVRGDDVIRNTPFIFLTARSSADDFRAGMDMGATDYVPKPFTSEQLLKAIHTRLKMQDSITQEFDQSINELRENIIYSLPHELRTPLQGIMGFAEILGSHAERMDADQIREFAGSITSEGRRLNRLIENYLSYMQLEMIEGNQDKILALRLNRTETPSTIVEQQARECAALNEREQDLEVTTADAPVQMSEDSLDKIVMELVDNACKFSDPGTPVKVQARPFEGQYRVCVMDHGRGMSKRQIQDMGAYMQFERRLYEQQGIGFGFTLVKKIVELHAGELVIRSKPDAGTLVCAILPKEKE